MVNFFIMLRVVYFLIIIFVVACGGRNNRVAPQSQLVKYVVATPMEYVNHDFAALTTADDAVTLAFKISGRVADIPVAKGMAVKKGQLLAELDKRDVELQVEASRAALHEAELRLERARRLLQHSAISEQEVESIENAVAQAESQYENSVDLLNDTRIVAPFAGVVERTYVDAFQRVSSGENIVRIVNPVSTTVGFTAPEELVSQLSLPTTRFTVEFDAWRGVHFDAVIKSYARTSSDALGFPVSLRLVDVDTSRYRISPGMTCVATVTTPESDRRAVVVPLTAIYAPVGDGDYVWIIDRDNRVYRTPVELGSLTGDASVVVLRGIKAGERVVAAGVYHLTDGEVVRVEDN
jgi:RND family efflux transporter MFP subunit